MADLYALVIGLNRPQIALALDTGHANMVTSVAIETDSASHLLKTTHVHDNNGRHDVHLPPGHGTVDWEAWVKALDRNDYRGPIMLECIQYIRRNPTCITPSFLDLLHSIANPA
jgi:sugar phosphate isomerase/epimerase